jgi:hypothetical protein
MMASRMTHTSARSTYASTASAQSRCVLAVTDRQYKAGDDDGAQEPRPAPNCAGFIAVELGPPLHWRPHYRLGASTTSRRGAQTEGDDDGRRLPRSARSLCPFAP